MVRSSPVDHLQDISLLHGRNWTKIALSRANSLLIALYSCTLGSMQLTYSPSHTIQKTIMPYKALSECVKRQKNLRKKHDVMQNAVAAYAKEQLEPAVERRGARSIATQFKIPNQWRTIINQYKGGRSTIEAHQALQRLTPAEEAILVDFLNESEERGLPQSLTQYANLIRRGRLGADCGEVGDFWAGRFLDRHRDVLQTHWSKPLGTQRAQSMNPEAMK